MFGVAQRTFNTFDGTAALIQREKLTDFEVVWVDDKNEVSMTKGLQGVLRVVKQPTPGT